ncbi:acetolactate synthase large subunit [Streptomyces sp. H10-C2]|uniref:acetolactate synthase large subunit n=1 Tax=unclassified Streptomyces TaxID=2593676 RepID=UPI0024BB4341|nr:MULTISPECIES: acetolactate synthase large subunit [unclassified Streptomyces]MDJ0341834.1 acetolactate synthase large subunit [Streptomyces sp. PH10-H1]MDJ0370412.1 acetolactate synthase large subunit [Streptomyces sp. H10-C2]
MPNGAQTLIRTLVERGVEVCFANPGTSEMHFVAALDDVPEMRAVLCLFEGVATGAADGYARMTGRPACTLLHLGPGLANGLANLHNARRAGTPIVNIVGDHALHHKPLDAPLESDIDALAGTVSGWVRRTTDAADLKVDVTLAVIAASGSPGAVATLILPADVSWSEPGPSATAIAMVHDSGPGAVSAQAVTAAAKALRSGETAAILLGGAATHEAGLRAASRIAEATGANLLCETFPARLERGGDLPEVERLGYLADFASAQLDGVKHLILAGARSPVTFFAYPGKRGDLVPEGCEARELATGSEDAAAALARLADEVAPGSVASDSATGEVAADAVTPAAVTRAPRPQRPTGSLTAESASQAIGALLPAGAIVVDEANTSGLWLPGATANAPRHDWLTLTGGAIGQGLPVATGAAVACPGRPVVCLEADGSAMYTFQALWTQAREGLDVTTVVFNNSSYAILNLELQQVGASAAGERARQLLDLSRPGLDFVALATGMGVPATRATTAEEFTAQFERALAEPGPHLIDCVVPPIF